MLHAAEGLRDAVESVAAACFEPAPQHAPTGAVFHTSSRAAAAPETGGDAHGAVEEWGGGEGGGGGASGSGSDGEGGEGGEPFVSRWAEAGWLRDNPVGVPTEREYYVAATQGAPVYRILLVRR